MLVGYHSNQDDSVISTTIQYNLDYLFMPWSLHKYLYGTINYPNKLSIICMVSATLDNWRCTICHSIAWYAHGQKWVTHVDCEYEHQQWVYKLSFEGPKTGGGQENPRMGLGSEQCHLSLGQSQLLTWTLSKHTQYSKVEEDVSKRLLQYSVIIQTMLKYGGKFH